MRHLWKKLLTGVAMASMLLAPVAGAGVATAYADEAMQAVFTKYDFTDGSVIPTDTSGKEDVSSADGKLTVRVGTKNAYQYNGAQHGVAFKAGNSIEIKVDGPAVIEVGDCSYSNSDTLTLRRADGKWTQTASAKEGCYHNDGSTVTFIYDGEAATLVLSFEGTTYIPYITVTANGELQDEYPLWIIIGAESESGVWDLGYYGEGSENGNNKDIVANTAVISKGKTATISVEMPSTVARTWFNAPMLLAENVTGIDFTVDSILLDETEIIDTVDFSIESYFGDGWWYESTGKYDDTQAIRLAGGYNEWGDKYIPQSPTGWTKMTYTITLNDITIGEAVEEDEALEYTWEKNSNGDIIITGLSEQGKDFTELVIPGTINGKWVVEIANNAFSSNRNITKVELPTAYGFEKIGDYAFSGCTSLQEINLPNSLKSIGHGAFQSTSLTSLALPKNLEYIGNAAFRSSFYLEEITLDPESIYLTMENGVIYSADKTQLIMVTSMCKEDTLTVPDTVISVQSYSFVDNTSIKKVVFPEGLVSLGGNLFNANGPIEEFNIPSTVMQLEPGLLTASTLKNVTVAEDNEYFEMVNGSLVSKAGVIYGTLPSAIVDGVLYIDGVTSVYYTSYDSRKDITKVVFSNTVEEINNVAFINCSNLTEAVIPASVTFISPSAFTGCRSIVFKVVEGSYAEAYAKENNFAYELIVDDTPSIDTSLNGVALGSDGLWAYYVNGVVDTTFTGLAANESGTWYIENGYLNWDFTDLFSWTDGWYYVMDGRVPTEYTGLVRNDAGLWYVEGGKINQEYTNLVSSAEGWYYVMDGRVTEEYTGLVRNSEGLWYVAGGKLDESHTDLVSSVDGWFYVMNGRVTEEYTGLVRNSEGLWYVANGKLDDTYTNLVSSVDGWFYAMNGRVTEEYTGLVANENGNWYVDKGAVSLTHEGLICDATGWWYVVQSHVAEDYTGLATNDAGTWYVQNGYLDFGFSGEVTVGEETYTVVGGMVQ